MIILAIKIQIYYPHVHSLKEKRKESKSLIDRLEHKFRLSIREVADQDQWQSFVLGISFTAIKESEALEMQKQIEDFIYSHVNGQVLTFDWDLFSLEEY
ncbi:MAG TPA: DUF503 domain-containing protein, partial [Candidatus Eisenbacteria bacterium]|nr:DUF503 domain-containing protein [Candidatus Eisenbacteria bacterium]